MKKVHNLGSKVPKKMGKNNKYMLAKVHNEFEITIE